MAVLNLTLIALLQLFSRRDADTGKKPAAVRVYTVILAVFTLALIVTALRKMLLYIDGYGLTALRVYTSWFMVLLGMVFLLVIASQFATRLHLARGIGAAFILLFALLNFADVDARMAAYNVEHYRAGTWRRSTWPICGGCRRRRCRRPIPCCGIRTPKWRGRCGSGIGSWRQSWRTGRPWSGRWRPTGGEGDPAGQAGSSVSRRDGDPPPGGRETARWMK